MYFLRLFEVASAHSEYALLTLILIMICALFFLVVYMLSKRYERQQEAESIAQGKLYLEHELKIMEQEQLRMDCLRHDMKNHFYRIEVLAQENNTDDILRYVRRGREHLTVDTKYVSTGNKNLDCMLNFKLDEAKNKNISFTAQTVLPNELYINSFDLNTILGNLLDNAIEAVEKASEKKLDIFIKYNKNTLIIKIGNSFDGKVSKNLKTTKANSLKHGLGLKSVQFIVKKYNGLIHYDYDNGYFVTKILLYND